MNDNKSREATAIIGIIMGSIITTLFGIINTRKAYRAQDELDARLEDIENNIADNAAQITNLKAEAKD